MSPPGSLKSFTLQDVWEGRVRYRHDGSEDLHDSLSLELQFVAQKGYRLPSYLQVICRLFIIIILQV